MQASTPSTVSLHPSVPTASHDRWLEGLRGLAALLVATEHLSVMGILYPSERISPLIRFLGAGQAAVLVFFVLSGYVISLTNQVVFTAGRARAYLGRRALRLLPIYWLALALTLCVGLGDPVKIYAATALMLQNQNSYGPWLLYPPRANAPMWSLHYEMVYYLLFLVIWRREQWFRPSMLMAIALSIAGWILPGFPRFIAGYGSGWLFWGAGWWLARQTKMADTVPHAPLLAYVFLLIGTYHLSCGNIFLSGIGLPQKDISTVNLSNLAFLPCCLLLVSGAARRTIPFRRVITWLAFGLPIITSLLLIVTGRVGEMPQWIAGAIFTAMALLVAAWRSGHWLGWLAPMGSISYAFYLLHMPMFWVVRRLGLAGDTPLRFAGAVLIWFSLTAMTATVLELWLQPRLRRWWQARPILTAG
jgi:peptidoglycan/LPS O-acetylase OafA/YrhL